MDNYYTKYIKYKSKYLELKGIKGNGSINNVIKGGGNDGAYYSKYMKYKTKYIKEGGLVGGKLQKCNSIGFIDDLTKSVWWFIRNTDCSYYDLTYKIINKLRDMTYNDFIRTNNEHPTESITIGNLKNKGFPAIILEGAKFPLNKLKEAGYSATDLKNIEPKYLKEAGYSANELANIKYTLGNITLRWFTLEKLKEAGYSASELKEARYDVSELKEAGFTAKELKEAGFTAKELKKAGFVIQQLKEAEFTAKELKEAEFTAKEAWFTLKQFKEAGFTAKELKEAGFSVYELEEEGFDIEQLIDAGYISILKDGKNVYPSAYIDDTLLLLEPRVLASLFQKKDKKIQFLEYDKAYELFYSKLKEYVYQKYGNNENMNNLKTNWKISLYGCHTSDPRQRYQFNVTRFNEEQESNSVLKPRGIYGSELSNIDSWISFVLDKNDKKITGHPGNCYGFLIFRLKDNDKILHILNKEELTKLQPYITKSYEHLRWYDWKKIAQTYHALNLQVLLDYWDVHTTVVWNIDAVAEYHFITLRDLPFVKNFINCEMLFRPNVAGQL